MHTFDYLIYWLNICYWFFSWFWTFVANVESECVCVTEWTSVYRDERALLWCCCCCYSFSSLIHMLRLNICVSQFRQAPVKDCAMPKKERCIIIKCDNRFGLPYRCKRVDISVWSCVFNAEFRSYNFMACFSYSLILAGTIAQWVYARVGAENAHVRMRNASCLYF